MTAERAHLRIEISVIRTVHEDIEATDDGLCRRVSPPSKTVVHDDAPHAGAMMALEGLSAIFPDYPLERCDCDVAHSVVS